MNARVPVAEVLETLLWGLDFLTQPSLSKALGGYESPLYRAGREALRRWAEQGLLEQTGRGTRAVFRVTAKGRQTTVDDRPRVAWARRWDGRWRVFSFDIPELRRAERRVLWRALRAHKFGLLQRSVWVWPHDAEGILREIVEAEGIPECFVGFEVARLFLCRDAELVTSAWNVPAIGRGQERYLRESPAALRLLRRTDALPAVIHQARVERRAYHEAFRWDPLLPRELWPPGYQGEHVQDRHEEFRRALTEQLHRLVPND